MSRIAGATQRPVRNFGDALGEHLLSDARAVMTFVDQNGEGQSRACISAKGYCHGHAFLPRAVVMGMHFCQGLLSWACISAKHAPHSRTRHLVAG